MSPANSESLRENLKTKLLSMGLQVTKEFRILPLLKVEVTPEMPLRNLYNFLKDSPEISKVWLNRKYKLVIQESLPLIGVPQVWAMDYNGTGIKIAIVDSGIAWDHPDFMWPNGSTKVIINKCFFPGHDDHTIRTVTELLLQELPLV